MFGVKRRKMIFKHRQTTNIRAAMLSLALVILKDQILALGYNGGLGAELPAGSRGRAPGQGSGGRSPLFAPLKLRAFSWMYVPRFRQISPFLMFGVKRRKMIFKHRQTTNKRTVMLSLALVLGCPSGPNFSPWSCPWP